MSIRENRIKRIKALAVDGEEALALSNVIVSRTIMVISSLEDDEQPDYIYPGPNNGALLIWRSGDNTKELSIEVLDLEVWFHFSEDENHRSGILGSLKDLRQLLNFI